MKKYTIGIPITANENNTIRQTMSSLEKDLLTESPNSPVETLICLNNHNYETEIIVGGIKSQTTNPRIIYSESGLILAQRKVIEKANSSNNFVIFYDGDNLITPGSTKRMIDFMEDNPRVHAASGDQIAQKVDLFWYQVYNIIGLNPQIMTPRKYLTGRIFAVRKNSYHVPDFLVSDDTFLSHYLINQYGEEAVQIVPGASVEYCGPRILEDYYQKKRRLGIEKGKMYEHFPELKKLNGFFKKKRIPEQIALLSNKEKFQLALHDVIKDISGRVAKSKSRGDIWVPLKSTKRLR